MIDCGTCCTCRKYKVVRTYSDGAEHRRRCWHHRQCCLTSAPVQPSPCDVCFLQAITWQRPCAASMGAYVSTEAEDPGVTVVSQGTARTAGRDGKALLRQLTQLKHVGGGCCSCSKWSFIIASPAHVWKLGAAGCAGSDEQCTARALPGLARPPAAVAAINQRVCGVDRHVVESPAAQLCSRRHHRRWQQWYMPAPPFVYCILCGACSGARCRLPTRP